MATTGTVPGYCNIQAITRRRTSAWRPAGAQGRHDSRGICSQSLHLLPANRRPVAGQANYLVTRKVRDLRGGGLRFPHIFRKVSVIKLIEEMAAILLADFDGETRFELRAARGRPCQIDNGVDGIPSSVLNLQPSLASRFRVRRRE